MTIKISEKNIHWDYYLALENDIEKLARYIEFDKSNFETHSIELAHLLLAASSEADVVMKEFCKYLSPGFKGEKIDLYRDVIKEHFPAIINKSVNSHRYGLILEPWSNWSEDKNPDWWRSYNKVKHERSTSFSKANLKNVLNSMAGLFIVNVYFNHENFCSKNPEYPYDLRHSFQHLIPYSNLFKLDDPFLYLHE